MIHILYRTTEQKNKNNKTKPSWINNETCLRNLWNNREDASVHVFEDRLLDSTLTFVSGHCNFLYSIQNHGNSESFLEVFKFALDNFKEEDIVYFVEDDYIHRPNFLQIIKEGLEVADYISLYDHPDKYNQGAENLFYTKSTHWKYTHSTTMTFAAKISTLRQDREVFETMITTGTPPDHFIFLELGRLYRRLATPIPGYSTHGESALLSPIIKWKEYAK